jgi:ligand-binding sensor domain-containing protein
LVAAGGPDDAVLSLLADQDGSLWAGTQSSGLWRRAPDGVFTAFRSSDGLPSDTVRMLHRAKDGLLWLATPKGLATVTRKKGVTHVVDRTLGLPDDDIWQMVDDRAVLSGSGRGRRSFGFAKMLCTRP